MSTQEREQSVMIPLYAKRDIALVRGEGASVFDEDDNEYLDLSSQYGVTILGHANSFINERIAEQATQLSSCHQSFYNEARTTFCEKLVETLPDPLNKCFLSSTGTEAVEAALKFARATTGRQQVIAMSRAYHGRSYGSLSATHSPKYRKPFEPLVPEFSHIPFNDVERLKEALTEQTAAVILEVIQGEGGINIATQEFMTAARELCSQHGALLIIDEVQTGMGRTGKMWAFEHFNIVPDIVCISKGVANGFPLGVTVVTDAVSEKTPKGTHGTTFGGNPLAAVAGSATLDYISEKNLLEQVSELGAYFSNQLSAISSPKIREVRGMGLMIALELKEKCSKYLKALQEDGVIAISSGATVIRFLPPFVISKADIDSVISKLENLLSE